MPSFVATLATPCSPILSPSIRVGTSVPVPFSDSSLVASLPLGPLLQQSFMVGPSFSPIPVKTDSKLSPASMWICETCYSSTFRVQLTLNLTSADYSAYMTSWTKHASNMKGITLMAAFSLVLMFDVVFESSEFFHIVLFDISLEFAGFSSNFLFKCPEGYLEMA